MRKIFFSLIFTLMMPLFISITVFASNPIDAALDEYFNLDKEFNDDAYNMYLRTIAEYPEGKIYASCSNPATADANTNSYWTIYVQSNGSDWGSGNFRYLSNYRYIDGNTTQTTGIATIKTSQSLYSTYTIMFDSVEDFEAFYNPVDYDNPLFSSAIPVPELTVTYVGIGLALPTNQNGVYVDCIVNENEAFYIQLQAKYSVSDMVNVLLNDGVITYEYLDWYDGEAIDIYGLRDNVSSVHITAQQFQDSWDSVIDTLAENSSFPQFTTNVPFWMSNPEAAKYVSAKNRYKNVLMRQAPMYGSRMELFARYYAVVDSNVYVGRWVHWNSINPSNTEELSNQYQVDQPFPGYQNTSSIVDLPSDDNTYTNLGESTNVNNNPYTQVIVNSSVPNYPDYPTVATYNHDNILVKFITTANSLSSFFGEFGDFLTSSFSFIKAEIWAIIGFGFLCSIVVMIIKIL